MEARIGKEPVGALESRGSPENERVFSGFNWGGLDEVHAGLAVEGTAGLVRLWLLLDGMARVLVGSGTGEFEEFYACCADGVGPVNGALCMGDAAGDFVKEIGWRHWAVERSD
jgi:hypothetical protein